VSFTERAFRDAMGRFATGVVVVSARSGDFALGLTVNSFNSVSLQPPLVLFSLSKRALSFDRWQSVDSYAINVLGEDHEELSGRFAKAAANKWNGVEALTADQGVPILRDALISFVCTDPVRIDAGDHQIIVGRVIDIHESRADDPPLIFYCGRYRRLDREPELNPIAFQTW
jgi:flavin reductase (DIM6/NTAB) family NADH-FMN oxidoreductase RutF